MSLVQSICFPGFKSRLFPWCRLSVSCGETTSTALQPAFGMLAKGNLIKRAYIYIYILHCAALKILCSPIEWGPKKLLFED